jgi:beta-lactamase class A
MASARGHVPLGPRPELPFAERIAALEAAFSGRLGYHAVHLDSGRELALRADESFGTASVIKVALCAAVLDLVARGEARLDEPVPLPPRVDRVAGGGVLKQLDVDALSLRDLVELTIAVSDNVATNALLHRLGGEDALHAYLDGIGLPSTRMFGPIDFARIGPDRPGGTIGTTTPREQTRLLAALHRGDVPDPEHARLLVGCLGRQHFLDQLPRWLGANTYAQYHGRSSDPWVANKVGELDGLRCDVALVRAESRGTIAAAVFTEGGRDRRENVDCEGTLAVAECGAAIAAELLGLDA